MVSKRKKDWISQRDAKVALWNHFEEFVIEGNLASFCDHVGLKLRDMAPDGVWMPSGSTTRRTAESIWIVL